jgi:hypothetical protein
MRLATILASGSIGISAHSSPRRSIAVPVRCSQFSYHCVLNGVLKFVGQCHCSACLTCPSTPMDIDKMIDHARAKRRNAIVNENAFRDIFRPIRHRRVVANGSIKAAIYGSERMFESGGIVIAKKAEQSGRWQRINKRGRTRCAISSLCSRSAVSLDLTVSVTGISLSSGLSYLPRLTVP